MKLLATALFVSLFAIGSMTVSASAQAPQRRVRHKPLPKQRASHLPARQRPLSSTNVCVLHASSKAIDKNGKKLAGAAKNSFMAKCSKGG